MPCMPRFNCVTLEDARQDRQRETCREFPGCIVRGNLGVKFGKKTVRTMSMHKICCVLRQGLRLGYEGHFCPSNRSWARMSNLNLRTEQSMRPCVQRQPNLLFRNVFQDIALCSASRTLRFNNLATLFRSQRYSRHILMSDPETTILPAPKTISGRWLVIGMFAMGITATGLLYAYSTLHLGPFKPLQEAIVKEFPGSSPRVDGGKKRMQLDTPTILRILMKSHIDLMSETDESIGKIRTMRIRIAELALENVTLPNLAIIELHVYKPLQEDQILKRSYRLDLKSGADWIEIDQRGQPLSVPAAGRP